MQFTEILLQGKSVQHITYGEGIVTDQKSCENGLGSIITVNFSGVERKFNYPSSFEKYLFSKDEDVIVAARNDLAVVKDIELQKKEVVARRVNAANLSDLRNNDSEIKLSRQKKENICKRKNIAIKCNYNDGGKNESRIGFYGVCSDAMIKNNIIVEKRSWCSQLDCPCLQYFNGEITRKELDEVCCNGGWVCYESQMLREWKAMAGTNTQGEKRGEPRKLLNVQKNSLAVLTTRTPDGGEADRFIFAIFLVDDFGEGNGWEEGYVSTKSIYKMTFSESECKRLLFWKYHSNNTNPTKPVWASGLFRYITDEEAVQILQDVVDIKKGTPEEDFANEFLEYFCIVNGIDINTVGIAQGALYIK